MRQAWKLNTAVFLMVFGLLTAALPAWAALMGGSIQGTPLNLTNTNAVVTTLAGVTLSTGSTDGTGTAARFYNPYGITTDGTNLFIADSFNHTIRKIAIATGLVTTIAGSPGNIGSADGIGAAARFYEPKSITTDGTSLFVADFRNHTIRKIVIATGVVTTFAGSAGSPGSADGVGSAARFNTPIGITTDGTNLFIADTYNYTIRKIVISTAAVSTLAGSAGSSGSTNGIGSAARFWDTYGITTDGANLFVTDTLNHTIRKIVISTATVSTLAGSAGSFGSTDGTGSVARFFEPMGISTDGTYLYIGDNSNNTIRKIVISTAAVSTLAGSAGSSGSIDGSGLTSRFYGPMATTTDGSSLFVSDYYNQTIRKISPDTTAPTTISSPAGGTYTSAQSVTLTCSDGTGSGCDKIYYTTDGSTPTTSSGVYSTPINISATTTVKFFAKDLAGNSEALKAEGYSISPLMGGSIQGTPLSLTSSNAVVSTLAGLAVVAGSTDGTGTAARFNRPYGITTPDGENLYIADANNSTIRKMVISTGQVTTIAGAAGVNGSTDGTGTAARFNFPSGITTDGTNLYITDSSNYTIRKMVISTGVVTTIAGSTGLYGSADGTGSAARFYNSYDLTTDGTNLYVADTATHTIRKVVISSGVVTTLAGQGGADGATDGTGAAARFFYPYSITTDGTNLYVTDSGNSTIRKVVISTGVVTTMAGSAGITGSTDGTGTAAIFFWPRGITTDGGNLYVSDTDNATIRKIVISTGAVTTISGSAGSVGSTDGTGSAARFNWPAGINTDGINLFVSDNNNHTIRKISPDTTAPTGTISINSGASSTNSTSATLTLSCTDSSGCAEMQFSSDNTDWSTAEAYATSRAWTLTTNDGTKTAYVKFKDGAGNWSSAYNSTIVLDATAPTVSSGGNKTANAAFTQTATATDANTMTYSWTKQSGNGTITFGSSTALSTTVSADTDGTYTLRFTATDAAGNSASSDMTLVWDTTAPTLSSSATYVDSTHVDITFSEAVNGATTVSNYTANNGLTIIGVSSQGGNIYRLTTSLQAIGGSYTTTANSISDLAGNAINAAAKTATFTRTGNSAPSIPTLSSPANGGEITVTTPTLFINASTEPDGDNLGYRFEVSTDSNFATVNATAYVSYGTAAHTTASWTLTPSLNDNTTYYWRVQASDGVLNSNWMTTASFFVNTANDAPTAPGISSPANNAQVASLTPTLSVTNSTDVDNDVLTYSFDVASGSGFTSIIVSTTGTAQGSGTTAWTVSTTLNDNTTYYWRARATDEHGAISGYATGIFFVNTANDAPTAPALSSLANGSEATTLTPTVTVNNSTDADGDTLSYVFEVDTVNTFNSANRQTSPLIASGSGTTSWTPAVLSDNITYYWRVKANDGTTDSVWMTTASFFANTANDAPTVPTLNNPANNAEVTTLTPSLIVNAATDVDNDVLTYDFEVYGDSGLTNQVSVVSGQGSAWTVTPALSDNTNYYWRARARDEHNLTGGWMAANSFFVNNGGINDAPSITVTRPNSSEPATNANTFTIQWNDSDPDSNATITLYYDTNNAGNDGVQIATGVSEDDGTNSYMWDTSALPDGTYYVYAKIDDGTSTVYAYSDGPVTIDRTAPTTTASPGGGTYSSAQSVSLTAGGAAIIYYTTNGTTPTTASAVYSGPINVVTTTTLKFFAKDNAGNAGTVITETYVITAMNAIDTTPPANASNLNASSNADGSISLSWTAPSDADLSGYNIYRDGTKINSTLIKYITYKDSGVLNVTSYTYKVTSIDLAGNESSGVMRAATSTVQANTPPSAPSNVKAEDTGTGYSLKVVWPANTESDLAGYKVYWGTASGTYTNSQNAGNATSYTITGLTEGTRYYIAVTAYDSEGNESAKSIEAIGTPKAYASKPDVPTNLTVTPGNKYLTLSWTGISNVTGYMIYIGEADGVYGTPVRTANTTHTFQNLENNKTYYVAVSSYDLNSGSRYTISSESERTTSSGTPNDNDAPAVPSSLTTTDAGTGGKVVLKWDREESFDIAGYVVAYKKTGNSVFEGITSTDVTWSYAVTGLTNGQSYTFYVYAYDANGNFSDPSSVTATPTNSGSTADVTPPGVPILSAAPGNGKVTLMITPPSDTDIDHYNLYVYNLAAGKYMPLTSINGLSYEHSTGVDNGKALVFVATAIDTSGNESGYSASASAVPSELPGDIPLEEDPPVLDRVDGYDVNEIAKGFGSDIGKANYNSNSDLDGNGTVDGNDLLILGTNHGKKK